MEKKIYILIILFLFSSNLFSQTAGWQWAKSSGSTSSEAGFSIATDASGNYLVTGYSLSPSIIFGTDTLANVGGEDVFIVKYDPLGNVLWARGSGGVADERANGIASDADGNIIITGEFNSPSIIFGPDTLNNTGGDDFFVAKYDASGNVLWARSASGSSNETGTDVSIDVSGNALLTGYYQSSSLIFSTDTLFNVSNRDIFVVKYDASGNVLWTESAGSTSGDFANGIAADADKNVVVTGYFNSASIIFGSDTLINAGGGGNGDLFVAKYDSTGNILWARNALGTSTDFGDDIAVDASGNIFITGDFISPGLIFDNDTVFNSNISFFEMFVAKYDPSGNALWARSAEGSGSDHGVSVAVDTGGNAFVTGYTRSPLMIFGPDTLLSAGIFATKYDASGNVQWELGAGTPTADVSYAITADHNGNAAITGYYVSPTIAFGSDTLTNEGIYDVFVARICNNATFATINASACDSYLSPSGNYVWTSSGVFIDTILNSIGCDSIITVNLNIDNSSSANITLSNCGSFVSPSGLFVWTASGIYNDTILNTFGCDSILTVNLTILTTDTSVTPLSGVTLSANAVGATYQWLDCNAGYAVISGATGQAFTATTNGNYAASVTENGCTDTSACYNITGVGIDEIAGNDLSIYPNPSAGRFVISGLKTMDELRITNVAGQIVYQSTQPVKNIAVDLKEQGVYFLSIASQSGVITKKIVVTSARE